VWERLKAGGQLVVFRDKETLEYRDNLVDGSRVHD
jgi:hypothetical protein